MRRDGRRSLGGLAIALLVTFGVVSCASHAGGTARRSSLSAAVSVAEPAATGHARIGALTITDGYMPQPASPNVAAAYLTIANAGATADSVIKVTSNVTKAVTAMDETDHDGVGTMTGLHTVRIPAHGRVSLTPGHAHLMLENPTFRLRAGQHVSITITFAHAGTVTLTVPVVPLSGPVTTPSMSPMASP